MHVPTTVLQLLPPIPARSLPFPQPHTMQHSAPAARRGIHRIVFEQHWLKYCSVLATQLHELSRGQSRGHNTHFAQVPEPEQQQASGFEEHVPGVPEERHERA
ncbi:uncharacterized protein PHACADRAFT_254991 [Phanerochaete carnosa HHB-10118-sp]|uniref:Uncharacterized protein n=1 Tax=Phanerochaete carnosa (strain HHB-10118-sp) TaxID=650164 RepID=K5V411_PHACS|nr:uncharacterized protein PHACADRAFT_254991 [Phanerochaete carnosa HHB-10118-sp]EKM57296.1 hypothetical protein PHACADRAFT_254991 [Phanerochaete carnosa HHB-10118-sp]